jgi:hypothetical protein
VERSRFRHEQERREQLFNEVNRQTWNHGFDQDRVRREETEQARRHDAENREQDQSRDVRREAEYDRVREQQTRDEVRRHATDPLPPGVQNTIDTVKVIVDLWNFFKKKP